jgi:hypothetical protein
VEPAVGVALDPVAFLVDRPVVATAQQRQVLEPGGTAVRPVVDMVGVGGPPAIGTF